MNRQFHTQSDSQTNGSNDHETHKNPCGRPPAIDDRERRQKILSAASDVLKTGGSGAASMDNVAQLSGMSKKTLYQFFPSKRALFETLILERLFARLDTKIDPTTSLETQLTTIMIAMADHLLDDERLSLMRSIIAETNRNPLIAKFVTELFQLSGPTYDMQDWLIEQDKAGHLTVEDADNASNYLFGLTLGSFVLSQLTQCRPLPPRTERNAFIARGVRIFLKGYSATA